MEISVDRFIDDSRDPQIFRIRCKFNDELDKPLIEFKIAIISKQKINALLLVFHVRSIVKVTYF